MCAISLCTRGALDTWSRRRSTAALGGSVECTVSTKRLRSVAQSTGHHAVSGLCYVHPHLGEMCKAMGLTLADIDLLAGKVVLDRVGLPRPLELGASALGEKFIEILDSENIARATLSSARIQFQFRGSRWPVSCYIRLETTEGKIVEDAVSQDGRRAEIIGGSA
jgi:hypothetical protein